MLKILVILCVTVSYLLGSVYKLVQEKVKCLFYYSKGSKDTENNAAMNRNYGYKRSRKVSHKLVTLFHSLCWFLAWDSLYSLLL